MQVNELIWDEKNIAHIVRHSVIPEEVEEVCNLGTAQVDKARGGTYRFIGQTNEGRYLENNYK
jgi:hypothetical protein